MFPEVIAIMMGECSDVDDDGARRRWEGGVVGRGEEMKGARDENIDIYVIQPY